MRKERERRCGQTRCRGQGEFSASPGQLCRFQRAAQQKDRENLSPRSPAVNRDSDLTVSKKEEPKEDRLGLGEASGLCVLCQGRLL